MPHEVELLHPLWTNDLAEVKKECWMHDNIDRREDAENRIRKYGAPGTQWVVYEATAEPEAEAETLALKFIKTFPRLFNEGSSSLSHYCLSFVSALPYLSLIWIFYSHKGSFLVRSSKSHPENFVFTIKTSGGKIVHVPIKADKDKLYSLDGGSVK